MHRSPQFAPPPEFGNGERRAINGHLLLYIGMLASWLADFSASAAGEGLATQIIFLISYTIFLGLFFVNDRAGRVRIPGLMSLLIAGTIFVFVGLVTGISLQQETYALLRNAVPTVVFLTAAYATARGMFLIDPASLRYWLILMCLGYLVSGVISGFATSDLTLETVRYQIIGASVTPALGMLAMLIMFGINRMELANLLFAFTVVFVSITRSYLVCTLVQVAPLLRGIGQVAHRRIVLVALLFVVLVILVFEFGEFGLSRWIRRLFVSEDNVGIDPTFESRWSEWVFMIDASTQSLRHVLFGNGLAAKTSYFVPLRGQTYQDYSVGFGHNLYISLFFIGGLLGAGWFLGVLIKLLWRSILLLARFTTARAVANDFVWLAYWGAATVLGNAAVSMLSGILGHRGSSLWFGIGAGLLLGGQAAFLPENRHWIARRAGTAPSRSQ